MRYIRFMFVVFILIKPSMAEEFQQNLDEIVVTASRVGEKKSDAPVTISVVGEEEIEQVKFRNPDVSSDSPPKSWV